MHHHNNNGLYIALVAGCALTGAIAIHHLSSGPAPGPAVPLPPGRYIDFDGTHFYIGPPGPPGLRPRLSPGQAVALSHSLEP
jgi:hypothetical protein